MKDADFKIKAVITETDKPAGRKLEPNKSPVKTFAEEKGLFLLQPEKLDRNFSEKIKELNPDIAVLVAYGKKIPEELLKIPKKGFINVHPSLLPKYRGASPVQTAILNGDKKTGVTIFVLDEKIDRGPILAQKTYEMEGNETTPELKEKLSLLGAEVLIPSAKKYAAGELKPQKQDEGRAILTKQFSREDGKIDFKKSAEEIERMIRAFHPWPGAWTEIQKIGRIKITKAKILHPKIGCAANQTPGHIFKTEQGKMAIGCSPGSLIVEKLIPQGKKEMSGEEFLRGYRGLTNHLKPVKI